MAVSRMPWDRARETTLMARMESPPTSKKLSLTPTRSTPNTSAHTRARSRSVSVRGSTWSTVDSRSSCGAGSARRSTLPVFDRGSTSIGTNQDGT